MEQRQRQRQQQQMQPKNSKRKKNPHKHQRPPVGRLNRRRKHQRRHPLQPVQQRHQRQRLVLRRRKHPVELQAGGQRVAAAPEVSHRDEPRAVQLQPGELGGVTGQSGRHDELDHARLAVGKEWEVRRRRHAVRAVLVLGVAGGRSCCCCCCCCWWFRGAWEPLQHSRQPVLVVLAQQAVRLIHHQHAHVPVVMLLIEMGV